MAMSIPEPVRYQVIAELYRRMDQMQWEQISPVRAAAEYGRFVDDPQIGGVLEQYMPSGQIRVWIKDGPAKEYRRALEGVGSYAAFTSRMRPQPQQIVENVLGAGWRVEGEIELKPMRCWAENGTTGEKRRVIWGEISGLKELIWHAALQAVSKSSVATDVVITKPTFIPLPGPDWQRVQALAELVGADAHQVAHAPVKKSSWQPPQPSMDSR